MLPPNSISADAQERAPATSRSGLQTGSRRTFRIVRLIPEDPEQLRNFVAELRQVCAGDDGEDDSPVEEALLRTQEVSPVKAPLKNQVTCLPLSKLTNERPVRRSRRRSGLFDGHAVGAGAHDRNPHNTNCEADARPDLATLLAAWLARRRLASSRRTVAW